MSTVQPITVQNQRLTESIALPLTLAVFLAAIPAAALLALAQSPALWLEWRDAASQIFLLGCTAALCGLCSYLLTREARRSSHPGVLALGAGFAGQSVLSTAEAFLRNPARLAWINALSSVWICLFACASALFIAWPAARRACRARLLRGQRCFWAVGWLVFFSLGLAAMVASIGFKSEFSRASIGQWSTVGGLSVTAAVMLFVLRLYVKRRSAILVSFALALFLHALALISMRVGPTWTIPWWYGHSLNFVSLLLIVHGILDANRLQERQRLIETLSLSAEEFRQSRLQLERSESRYGELVRNATYGIYRATTSGNFLEVNPALVEMLGYQSDSELLALNLATDIYCDPAERKALLARCRQTGRLEAGEVAWKRKNGQPITVRLRGRFVSDASGTHEVLEVIVEDISQEKRAETERQVMFEIAQGVTTTAKLDDLLRLIHQELKRVIYAENCFIALYDQNTGLFTFPFSVDQFDPVLPPQKLERSCTAYVLRTGQPQIITEERFKQLVGRGEVELIGTPSPTWLGVPLRTPSATIGVLAVQHYEDGHAYSERDREFVASVGSQIAVAIERKRTEEELRNSEAKFRALTETAASAIFITRTDDTFAYLNPQTAALTGYTEAELLRKSFWDLIHPDSHAVVKAHRTARLQRRHAPPRYEVKILHNNGEYRWIDLTAALVDYQGEAAILGTAFDITERKQAEERLRLYSHIISHTNEAIAILDPQGCILEQNAAHRALLEYPDEELIGKTPAAVMGDAFAKILEELSRSGTYRGEIPCRSRSGQQLVIELSVITLRKDNGEVLCHVGLKRDITQRKQLEGQLRQSQKMEAVGRLAGGVAHDFNNLLNVIIGYSEIVLDRLDAADPIRRNIEEVRKAGERAASLTKQLLAFSRKQVLEPRVLDLNPVVADMDGMLRRLIGEDIELGCVLDPALGHVKADLGQIEQVIMNLAVNARDAMPQGGKLIIETANADLDESYSRQHPYVRPGRYVMLAVSDTGVGMDQETQAHIFEPFFTTKPTGEGTGLGLATVYGIVKQSGGHIWVYSEPGQGSSFKVYLPRIDSVVKKEDVRKVQPQQLRGTETILFVEDAPVLREMACEYLRSAGYTVLEAGNGDEALAICAQHGGAVDLLVTDVVMPGMSGRELALQLSSRQPQMKVFYVSGYTGEALGRHGVLDPGVAFLPKPFSPTDLVVKVRTLLNTESMT